MPNSDVDPRGNYDCWALIALDMNLPPEERYKDENVMILALIPGPNEPLDIDSFLLPIVKELMALQTGMYFYDFNCFPSLH